MTGFLGEPTRLFMKPEKPDFFRRTADLGSLPSSEYRLVLPMEPSVGARGPRPFSDRDESIPVKLAEGRKMGVASWESAPILRSGG